MPADAGSGSSPPLRVPELDGLRGIAILLVMLSHFGRTAFLDRAYPVLGQALRAGWIGVDLFFVLSGYLITGILLRSRGVPGAIPRFYFRRAVRIWPLYLGACALILWVVPAVGLATPREAEWLAEHQWWYWAHLTNVLGAKLGGSGPFHSGHLWSLAVEEQFYLAWPWLVFGVSLATLRRVLPALAMASAVLWAVHGTYGTPPWAHTALFVLPLSAGGIVALHAYDHGTLDRLTQPASRVGVATLLVLAAVAAAGQAVNPAQSLIPLGARPVLALAGACALIRLVARPTGRLARVCRTRWLVRLGVISYGLYVIHNPLRTLLPRLGVPLDTLTAGGLAGRLAYVGLMCGISMVLAAASWRYLEEPLLRLRETKGRLAVNQTA